MTGGSAYATTSLTYDTTMNVFCLMAAPRGGGGGGGGGAGGGKCPPPQLLVTESD
jgi:hypothetical protein